MRKSYVKSVLVYPLKSSIVRKILGKKVKLREGIPLVFAHLDLVKKIKVVWAFSLFYSNWFGNLMLQKPLLFKNVKSTFLTFWDLSVRILPIKNLPMRRINAYNGKRFGTFSFDQTKFYYRVGAFMPTRYLGPNKKQIENKKNKK